MFHCLLTALNAISSSSIYKRLHTANNRSCLSHRPPLSHMSPLCMSPSYYLSQFVLCMCNQSLGQTRIRTHLPPPVIHEHTPSPYAFSVPPLLGSGYCFSRMSVCCRGLSSIRPHSSITTYTAISRCLCPSCWIYTMCCWYFGTWLVAGKAHKAALRPSCKHGSL